METERKSRDVSRKEAGRAGYDPLHRSALSADTLADPLMAPVQADTGAVSGEHAQKTASKGLKGSGGALPHRDRIQRSFGHHDVSGVTAHTGADAVDASRELGANGFTRGSHVALTSPDLHLAAHEAAHTVQQQQGVQLSAGVGSKGDVYERNADAVADKVVAGESAQGLLDTMAGGGGGGGGVQFDLDEAELDHPLKAPDFPAVDGAQVWSASNGGDKVATVNKSTRIKLGTLHQDGVSPRYAVSWYIWDSKAHGYKELKGFIDQASVTIGTSDQTKITDDAEILPPSAAGIKAEDVFQNNLSDCYFQASMASVAQSQPGKIFDLFEVGQDTVSVTLHLVDGTKAGEYAFQNPQPAKVTVAKSLLIGPDGQPVYGGKRGAGHYLWPAFMGKAWAVVKGSYGDAAMGKAGHAMMAITGKGDLAAVGTGDTEAAKGWNLYSKIQGALAASGGAALATSSFAKEGWWKQWLNDKGKGLPKDMPQGKVRGLHAYGVFELSKMDLGEKDFKTSIPKVDVTLRDPRDAEGGTFTRSLKDIVTAGKFTSVHWWS